ncbi:MAG TPA: erythromycin biosynthesis sensory transduction protein eryC1, partial [Coxiellaceae bacterium]|nr:erythromycin biosynthesis sensory transduction protein eryC1 [Coxiellaceae bacterium]
MPTKIYCGYPPAQFQSYKQEILEVINRVCDKGPYILGPEVEAFESEFAAYHGIKHCIGVGSGTDALALTLRAFDIGKEDEVITVSHTALATAAA